MLRFEWTTKKKFIAIDHTTPNGVDEQVADRAARHVVRDRNTEQGTHRNKDAFLLHKCRERQDAQHLSPNTHLRGNVGDGQLEESEAQM